MADTTQPKPMDPERLAEARQVCHGMEMEDYYEELFGDRDYWEAAYRSAEEARKNWKAMHAKERLAHAATKDEAKRYRARCPIEASEVEAAGVTWAKAHAWADAQGFGPCDADLDGAAGDGLSRLRRSGERCGLVFEMIDSDPARFPQSVAYSCNSASKILGRPAFDILDEMAAMTEEPDA